MYQSFRYFVFVFALGCVLIVTSSCTETQYVAHVAKQIPFPNDNPKTVGYYKVGKSYTISGTRYYPAETYNHTETGVASWYGPNFHGKMTANGEIFDKHDLTAAHRTLQMPSIIRVTNLGNGRSLYLRVNDRGPFSKNRVLDVSERAATLLGFKKLGTAKVKIEVMPEASREVAAMAKAKQDTTGYEIALNRNKIPSSNRYASARQIKTQPAPVNRQAVAPLIKPASVAPVQSITLSPPNPSAKPYVSRDMATGIDGTMQITNTNAPIPPQLRGDFFVQAGAFSQEQNALTYSTQMTKFAPSRVYRSVKNNQPLYRVRLGPFDNRDKASVILSELKAGGNNQAVIVVD